MLRYPALAVVATLAGLGSASAHHSPAAFDESTEVVVDGVLTRVAWKNPFVSLTLETDGASAPLTIEAATVSVLERQGVDVDMLRPGEAVTVRAYPSRLGDQGTVFGVELVREDGVTVPLSPLSPAGERSAGALTSPGCRWVRSPRPSAGGVRQERAEMGRIPRSRLARSLAVKSSIVGGSSHLTTSGVPPHPTSTR